MSQLKLTADSGGGTVAIKAPASTTSNSAFELTLPGTGNRGLGKILQIVRSTKTDVSTLSTSGSSWADISSLTLDITPTSTSSKILITLDTMITSVGTNSPVGFRLFRDSTIIGTHGTNTGNVNAADCFASQYSTMASNVYWFNINRTHYDSPSTVSEITYKVQWRGMNNATAGTFYMNSWSDGSYKTNSSLTAMEVAA